MAGVVSFYTMFHTQPVGGMSSTSARRSPAGFAAPDELVEHLEGRLGIKAGETTKDGRHAADGRVPGSCGTAPMCQLDDDYHENLTFERIDQVIDGLK